MGRFSEIAKIYDDICRKLRNPQMWERSIKSTAMFWRLSFCEAMLLIEQKPQATLCGTFDMWNKAGRMVRRGEHAAAVFKHRSDSNLKYLFDISQTYGRAFREKWKMSDALANALVSMFNDIEGKEAYPSLEDYIQDNIDKSLYDCELKPYIEKDEVLATFVRQTAECICLTRCGINRSYDFTNISNVANDLAIVEIGNAAAEVAQNVLQPIETAIRRNDYGILKEGNSGENLRYPLRRGRERDTISGIHGLRTQTNDSVGTQGTQLDERDRSDSSGHDKYERAIPYNLERDWNESGGRSFSDRRKSPQTDEAQQGTSKTNSAARGDTGDSGRGSVGDIENVRELAVEGSETVGDIEIDWSNSSGYGLNESIEYSAEDYYDDERATSDETEAAFFVLNPDLPHNDEKTDDIEVNVPSAQEAILPEIAEKKKEELRSSIEPHNYHFPTDFIYPNGPKAKYNANVAAIKTLKQIEAEHRNATPQEQDILAHYSGWGGVSDAFDDTKENWTREYAELRELLSSKEYEAAKESTLTAFYTEPYIVRSIYAALDNFGFKGGDILDPSMGTGNFFGNMPEKMLENSRLYGVELDSITARIARQLYPNADVQNKGYEHTKFENNRFDIIVGNVPFGNYSLYDREYEDYLIHDYFFVKSLDKLKAGGIMAFITSSGTMDKRDDTLRRTLYGKADFVGGVRLPNDAFKTAGTQTVTDILFFQKLSKERENKSDWEKEPFLNSKYCSDNFIWGGYHQNNYFILNKEMVLGRSETVSGQFGKEHTIVSDGDTKEKLEQAISKLSCVFSAEPSFTEQSDAEDNSEDIPEDVQPYTYYIDGGKLYYAENRNGISAEDNKYAERIRSICGLFEKYEEVFAAQKNNCSDNELKDLQASLNSAYDSFVKKHGYLNTPANILAFRDDVRFPRICAIENVEETPDGTINYRKADIFTQRVINVKQTPTHVDTPLEALHLSLNLRQSVDLEYMSQLCGLSKDDVITALDDRIYCNPAKNTGGEYSGWETAEEYLSGYVRSKLALAQEAAKDNPKFERNVSALLENQPPQIDITNIGYRLGTIYIPVEYVRQFIYETFETPQWQRADGRTSPSNSIDVKYIDHLNEWKITNASSRNNSVLVTQTYGTTRLNAYQLTELTLNQKRAVVNDYRQNTDGKIEKIFNADETILARECQDKIEQAFHDWIMADKTRVQMIEKLFNEKYNNIKPRKFDGSYINIEGMNPNLTLRPHQKNVIARIASTGTCMMAHEVGAGKTAAMAAAGMYLKSIGVCHKPMYVVPNAVVGQFAEEFQRFFPEARILAATAKDMEKTQRRRFLSKISVGNYDAVIIPQSQFEKMPLSLERQEDMYNEKLSEISLAMQVAKKDRGDRFTVKAFERQKKQLEKKIEKLRADFKKDDFITFEELGCDFLFVDEAHNYKNLAVFSKMNNVAGVNTNQNSQKAFDMEMKCRYLQELHNGGGVVLASGTPISNSITELFVWQYLLQKQTLEDMQIAHFDNWASVYGVITQSLEIKPSSDGFRMRTRFSNFVNLPELCNLFGDVFDIAKTAEMNLQLPEIKGGKPEMIICEKSPEQEMQTEEGIERARRIEAKLVKPKEDNMLAVCTYMTKVALDARILDSEAEEFDGGKVAMCAEKIIDINRDNPNMAQAVFCDTNTPKKDEFSVYQALKDRLTRSGIFTEKEIAFVHDAANDKQRLNLFERVNSGEVKVIIGSTSKLGTGVNIQQRLIALHHLDAPYRPSDIEQRNGRGIRQGNTNKEVYVGYYSTKGTFDNYRWQLLEKKQQIISQIMSGKPAARSCEDVDEVALTFSEMKAATTDNPLLAEKMTVDNEVNRLKLLKNNHYQQQLQFERDVNERYPNIIAKKEAALTSVEKDIEYIRHNTVNAKDNFKITLNGITFTERAEAGKSLEEIIKDFAASTNIGISEKEIGEFGGFKLSALREGLEMRLRLENFARYYSDCSYSGLGGITRICNLYERIPEQAKSIQRELAEAKKQLENASQQIGKPFPYEQQLKELIERQSHINSELEFCNKPREDVIGDNDCNEDIDMEM